LISQRIAVAIHAAAAAPGGVEAGQDALAERAEYACADWLAALAELRRVEAHMVKILDELHLTHLVTTIPGISAVGAAASLAETGDPSRDDDPRAWVKHAGLAPRANESGTFRGATRTTGRGRPRLRTAAWRAIWGRCHTTPSTPAAMPTSPAADTTSSTTARPAVPWPRRCRASSCHHHPAGALGSGDRQRGRAARAGDSHSRLMPSC
jgi:hypothetical protein